MPGLNLTCASKRNPMHQSVRWADEESRTVWMSVYNYPFNIMIMTSQERHRVSNHRQHKGLFIPQLAQSNKKENLSWRHHSSCLWRYYALLFRLPLMFILWWRHQMETFFALLALFEGNPPVIPLTKASDVELWCLPWSAPERTVVQTIETPVIWDAIGLNMTSL